MEGRAKLFTLLAAAVAIVAGCASPETTPTPTTATSPTGTTPATMTPTVTPTGTTPTPTMTTPVTPTDDGPGGPPPMKECEGDYVDDDAVGERLGMPELRFTAKDPDATDDCFAFVGPQNASAGWNVFRLTYPEGGRTFHIMPMYNIGTHTLQDFMGAMAAAMEGGEEPEWAVPVGAVGGVTSGSTGAVALNLTAGLHVYFCPIDGHMFQGMMGTLNVTEGDNDAAPPTEDATVTLVDFNFTLPEITDHVQVLKVVNEGAQPHEMPLVRLVGNATAMEFLHALEDPNAMGPPPGEVIGGVNAIAPGQVVYLLTEFEEGERWAAVCFVESPEHGVPHVELGMLAEFTIAGEHADEEH